MPAPKLAECQRVLIVEGKDDLFFFAELLEDIGKYQGVFIQEMGGRSLLETNLENFIHHGRLREKTHVAVVVDADTNGLAIASKLTSLLSDITGQNVTEGAWTEGTPRIGLLVVPSPENVGEIEDVVWNAWAADPANAAAKACIETYETCMRENAGLRAHSSVKGRLGSLLALKHDEDPRLGPAARANVFNFSHPGYERVISFLRNF
jgi:5S rRNA maturation endonuclease (ribonuclease M5)